MPADLRRLETIVIVMMENRSFDHVLGYLSREGGRRDVNGLGDDAWIDRHENPGPEGPKKAHHVTRMDIPDPPHEREDIELQIGATPGSPGPMKGFVMSYAARYPPPDDDSLVMGYY